MGKAKRKDKPRSQPHHHNSTITAPVTIKRRQHSQIKHPSIDRRTSKADIANAGVNRNSKQRTPFSKLDRVLLVGEGDFSFALSLAKNYDVASVVATSYDDEQTLTAKYPKIRDTLRQLQYLDTDESTSLVDNETEQDAEWNGFSDDKDSDSGAQSAAKRKKISVMHGIDATKLFGAHRKALNPHAPFTKIVFNFPHTGGLSTDVNRQVRANQELLVAFFNAAKSLLATSRRPAQSHDQRDEEMEEDSLGEVTDDDLSYKSALKTGYMLVTLFEGEPYTLWNIRDLARHCGLQVVESFKFAWAAFPGYQHARTIGDVITGKDRTEEGKRKGAWRGEERDARCYVLGIKDELQQRLSESNKRRRAVDSDESD